MTEPSYLAVLGDPIGHSRSPIIHRYWMGRPGHPAPDTAYLALPVAASDLPAVISVLPRMGVIGVNLTLPHKEAGLALAAVRSQAAEQIGAANTLHFRDGRIEAHNTDAEGFLDALRQGAPAWQPNRPAVVLGAGGAARAVVWALAAAGVPEIHILNRTVARAEALANGLGDIVPATLITGALTEQHAVPPAGLLVNATALGMTGQPPLDHDLTPYPEDCIVMDLVYSPLETPLLRAARSSGRPAVDGLGMLLHQAARAQDIWFRVRPEVDAAVRALALPPAGAPS